MPFAGKNGKFKAKVAGMRDRVQEEHPVEKERRFRMNCPYCAKEMESGYLRGGSGYELLWTEEPFKMTSLPTGNDFFVCKASDVYRPIAHLCRTCGKIAHPAAFAARRRQIILIVFSDDTCVRKNTSQPASVEFARQGGQIMRTAGCIPQNKRNRPIGTVPFILRYFIRRWGTSWSGRRQPPEPSPCCLRSHGRPYP